jgi:hypothetical protein
MKTIVFSLLLSFILAGCAKINDTTMQLLSSSSAAVAVVNDTVLSGKAVLFTDRSGTLSLESGTEPQLKCMGRLRYTATQTGVVSLQCSDGTDALLTFTAISETSGHGSGKTARGMARFTYGLEMAEAAAYLKLPAIKPPVTAPEGEARTQ